MTDKPSRGRITIESTGEQYPEEEVVLLVSTPYEPRDILALREVLRAVLYLPKEEALRVLRFALDKTEGRP